MKAALAVRALAWMVLIAAAAVARAAMPFGEVEFVEGHVSIVDVQGHERPAQVGQTILEGETLVTGADGELHAHTTDSGFLALRANTRLTVQAYRAAGRADDSVLLSLARGTLRIITGWAAKLRPHGYQIHAGNATIGIRGTDHEPLFLPPGDPAGPPGTYDKVNTGATYIDTPAGRVEVGAGHAGFAPHDGRAPQVLEKVPEFYRPTRNEARITERKAQLEKESARVIERLKAAGSAKQSASGDKTTTEGSAKETTSGEKAATEGPSREASGEGKGGEGGKEEAAGGHDEKAPDKGSKEERRRRAERRHHSLK